MGCDLMDSLPERREDVCMCACVRACVSVFRNGPSATSAPEPLNPRAQSPDPNNSPKPHETPMKNTTAW